MSEVLHNCGFCVTHSLNDAYSFISDLQHRGREAAGIAAIGDRIDVVKWRGTVATIDLGDLYKLLRSSDYHIYMAHVRYATRGRKDMIMEDAHPHVIGGSLIDRENHVVVRGCEMAVVHNGQVSDKYLSGVDRALLRSGSDTEALLHVYREIGEGGLMASIPGAYTMAIADVSKKDVIVMRDRTGIKPGVLGYKDGKYGVASEDIAFRKGHGRFEADLTPGTVYYLSPNGAFPRLDAVVDPAASRCFFEYNYIADMDSVMDGVSVRTVRQALGSALAEEYPVRDADLVTFMPRCPEPAAKVYAAETGKLFESIFYKLRGERSFMGSSGAERENSIGLNLHVLDRADVRGMHVVVVDDSTIRGNNSKRGIDLLRGAGVRRISYLNYTPMIGIVGADGVPRGCEFGVDMPPQESPPDHEFIARGRSRAEIAGRMRVDDVYFLSYDGMLRAFERSGIPRSDLCTYCIGGEHPLLQIQ
ncbi:MAG: hypothetical protein HYW27_04465 [Candidatus Aenigmarchaeota archaeon]|nr:hypothetical protein [Candidatus Aenigmarchaeota archaeon]